MTETFVLQGELRKEMSKKHTARLRGTGKLPAVVYGHGKDTVSISLNSHDFVEGLHHGHRIFEVKLPEGKETLLVKDLQYDHLGKDVIHADLVRVDLSERMVVTVPIELRGTAKGTHEGGIVDQILDHLEVECVVSDIPDVIPIVVKDLGIDEAIHAREAVLPEGMVLKTNPEAMICICHLPKVKAAVEEEAAVEAPEGPEVITERAAEEAPSESEES